VLPLLTELGLPTQPVTFAAGIVGQLLWFLAVYLITVTPTPLMIKLRDRFGLTIPVVPAIAATAIDVIRFSGVPHVGHLNEAFVWLALQQLGIEYAAGRFTRLSTSDALVIGFGGFAATALLVVAGPCPASMVGLPGQAVSNMSPATLCLLTLGVGQFGLLLAARRHIVAFSRGPKIAALRRVIGLGYTTPTAGTSGWLLLASLAITRKKRSDAEQSRGSVV
jgi:hypothetical protein